MQIQDADGSIHEVNHVEYYIKYRKDYKEFFKKCSNQKLIDCFNGQVRNAGWCTAKMIYLDCLKNEIKKRFDMCSVINDDSCSYANHIYLKNKKVYIKNEKN